MRGIRENEEGVSLVLEYVLFSLICVGFFMIIAMNSDAVFIQNPNNVVMEREMSDVGNMMSTMITDMYLILPDNGYIDTEYRIPQRAGREEYVIDADIAYSDQIIEVISPSSGKKVRVTIGGIATTMPINGTAFSSSTDHKISYDSRK
ncbi:hypothetical protein [Methanolobus profundi]|uniref:Uncharacterized protein n=1 Tax=Methanolobus profundi TaxID=487685 RepID=A0A1I4SSB4_9EURY|nr:hypothetical protein [Methanolobus profundi]SFM67267.1 hypothetical protein SAMN04488696_1985 [Methanolobus profundi]